MKRSELKEIIIEEAQKLNEDVLTKKIEKLTKALIMVMSKSGWTKQEAEKILR